MKSCPTCKRTFEDDLTYCLVDGAILSAPYDPQATQRIPEPRITHQPLTEILLKSNALPPTIRSPIPLNPPVPSSAPQFATVSPPQKSNNIIKRLIRGAFLGIIIGASAGSIIWVTHSRYYYRIDVASCAILGAILGAIIFPILRELIKYAGK
jgi:hypothetical protein